MESCVFCKIIEGREPASIVYRDEQVAAFMDIQPVNTGHVLIVPIAHSSALAELPPSDAAALMVVGQCFAAALRVSGLRCQGVDMFLADGEAAGQEVFHVHLHVFPRFQGDGFGFRFGPSYSQLPERAELEAAAASVRSGLDLVADAV